jgi:hypothetical protein
MIHDIAEIQATDYSTVAQQGDRNYATTLIAVFLTIFFLTIIVFTLIFIIRLYKCMRSSKTHPRKDTDPVDGKNLSPSSISNAEDQPSLSIASSDSQPSLLNDGIDDQVPLSIVSVYDQTLLSSENQRPSSYYASVSNNDQTTATIDNQSHVSSVDQALESPVKIRVSLHDQISLSTDDQTPLSLSEDIPTSISDQTAYSTDDQSVGLVHSDKSGESTDVEDGACLELQDQSDLPAQGADSSEYVGHKRNDTHRIFSLPKEEGDNSRIRSEYVGRKKRENTRRIFSLPKEEKKARFMRPRPKKSSPEEKSGSSSGGETQTKASHVPGDHRSKTHVHK